MDKRFTIFGFLTQVFMIYGITTGLLNIFCVLYGNDAEGYSTLFSLAGAGVSVATSLQFLLTVTVVMILRLVFMSDMLIKNMPLGARITAMFASVFAVTIGCVFLFGWFPVNDPLAWVMFIVCFAVSCTVSVIISTAAERQENRKLDEALKRIKEEN
ncbi:MAG: hypothetical protein IK093_10725 [Ruminiclostridium sp.]|nr:hypothetical protein [Ruminiclostridium sp.]